MNKKKMSYEIRALTVREFMSGSYYKRSRKSPTTVCRYPMKCNGTCLHVKPLLVVFKDVGVIRMRSQNLGTCRCSTIKICPAQRPDGHVCSHSIELLNLLKS